MGTEQKQKQIRQLLNALGWSNKQLADVLYEEMYCDEQVDIYETPSKFREKLKKQLQRPTTPESRLDEYIKIISEHPDFKELGLDLIVTKYVDHKCLNKHISERLKDISSWLDTKADN
ncbi:elongation factor Ts [Vibrio diazotrophicus]|jgi:hypothetical protein|uniref:Elongation factor Ts n=1 Tax=Vibrio diazotrophicus TaxID=685 RepID=A0ABX4W9V0_VIBDI|nr:elongation factor Ts [Vibrio diazotrophicus]MCZ4370617.1 elongation factor Ts [Vibrio diazotrophicus]PNH91970.1 elongation factor Ts [Vibrio diazotrophicus]PNH95735.1 elongation factor Ts [Vibrio diazotrophicus]PNI00642.1 elongation factor Ts [Vibrio diazotrophicus]